MAYDNSANFHQEMTEREAEPSTGNYTTLTQRREDDATYSEIRLNDRIQNTNNHPQKEFMCNSKLQFILIIVGVGALGVSSFIITIVIFKQNIDSLKEEIKSIKLKIREELVSRKPAMDQGKSWFACNNNACASACDNNKTCIGNSWSAWNNWGDCSVTCNGGIRTRTRTCDDTGYCSGTNLDIAGCNNNACFVSMVYFTMGDPNSQLVDGKVTFERYIDQVGGGFNRTTGEFVCPVAGLYHFYFSFFQKSTTYVYCYIKHNGGHHRYLTAAKSWSNSTYAPGSTSVYVELEVGDGVYVGDCVSWEYVYRGNYRGIFTGALINV